MCFLKSFALAFLILMALPVLKAQTCPTGTQPAAIGITRNPKTDQRYNFACLDSSGNLSWGIRDNGGEKFNVLAYGAAGDGATDDSGAFNAAFVACNNAGGGQVYVPQPPVAGKSYLWNNTVQDLQSNYCDLAGPNDQVAKITINTALGLNLSWLNAVPNVTGQIGGTLRNLWFDCSSSANKAILETDMTAASPLLRNIFFHGCFADVEWINSTAWNERISVDHVTALNNTHVFWFHQTTGDSNNSFAYSHFSNIHVTLSGGQDVYFADNGANVYGGHFEAQGNLGCTVTSPCYVFNESGTGNSFWGDFIVQAEGGDFYIFNCAGTNNSCNGHLIDRLLNALGVATSGSTDYLVNAMSISTQVASFTTTAASSDNVTAQITNGSHCGVTPTNATAAGMAGVYVSSVNFGTLTVTHPSTAGGTFDVYCTVPF